MPQPAVESRAPVEPGSVARASVNHRASLRLSCLTTLPELLALRGEWQRLVDAADDATIFQSWEWVTGWYEHFGVGKDLLTFAVRDEQGRLVGLAPCSRASAEVGGFRLLHLLGRGCRWHGEWLCRNRSGVAGERLRQVEGARGGDRDWLAARYARGKAVAGFGPRPDGGH